VNTSRIVLAVCGLLASPLACSPTPAAQEPPSPRVWSTPRFDDARAWKDLETVVGIGPRPSESPGMAQMVAYLQSELTKAGLKPQLESFESEVPVTPSTPEGKLKFQNLYADLEGAAGPDSPMVIVATHMDTKFLEDFVGANDGGSSTAVVLELARGFAAAAPRPVTYRFVFFDGEEAVRPFWEDPDNTYGSRHHAYELSKKRQFEHLKAMVLLDMIGDKDLKLTTEEYSTTWLREMFEKAGTEAGFGKHFAGHSQRVKDDHIPFLNLGVPVLDLIDFEYGPGNQYWHTSEDTLDKCSQESLHAIGQITLAGLLELEKKLSKP